MSKNSETNFHAASTFVESRLQRQQRGELESASGVGSSRDAASSALTLIDEVVSDYHVSSILDLGCGDWNWMRHARWRDSSQVSYEGWEAHPRLVDHLNETYGTERVRFLVRDINMSPLPEASLIICRDVLFHLPKVIGVKLVRRLMRSRSLLVTTSFLGVEKNDDIVPNAQIAGWGHYKINLDIEPFSLRGFRRRAVAETLPGHRGPERSVCLYDFNDADIGGHA